MNILNLNGTEFFVRWKCEINVEKCPYEWALISTQPIVYARLHFTFTPIKQPENIESNSFLYSKIFIGFHHATLRYSIGMRCKY